MGQYHAKQLKTKDKGLKGTKNRPISLLEFTPAILKFFNCNLLSNR